MTRKLLGATAILAAAAAAFAMTDIDTDGDGSISMAEFASAYPELGVIEFEAADADGNGLIDAEEHAAAVTAGVLPEEAG